MKKFLALSAAALLSSAALVAPANAGTFLLTYVSPGNPGGAQIWITTSDTLNSVGGFDILTAEGKVDGVDITGLIPNPNQPNPTNNGSFIFDNVAFSGMPYLNNNGLYFSFGGGQANLYSNSATSYTLYTAANGQFGANSDGTLSVQAVPEPATWGMMLVGFGLVGFGLRSRRKQSVRVTYA